MAAKKKEAKKKPGARAGRERRTRLPVPSTGDAERLPLRIVGVGASAGGLEAFSTLLQGLPANPGVAIVFIQHLAPQHVSALVPLLSGQSDLPVVQAGHGMEVEANRVYVIPPNTQMVIIGRSLHLSARPDDRSQYTPIDAFFSSLAETAGSRAIGVILSGTASDGALGVREIKAAGGITIAQMPESAKYDGMPRAAIATGIVDLVLAPKAIGPKLAELARHAYTQGPEKATTDLPLSDQHLGQVFEILQPVSGVDFRHYKLPTIKRRLFRRMALHRLTALPDYVRLLRDDPAEARSLYQDLLIQVTRFFREPESFEALVREVLPVIVQGHSSQQPIRAWVSGCATGEEAYSLAITIVEFREEKRLDIPVQIFATDVSETAVDQARMGVFPPSIQADVSPGRLRQFFTKHDGGYRVTKKIRDFCIFARQDLTKDSPFSRLDLILCRNVLIYMDTTLQKKLLSVFHYALNANGFLVLGHAETVGTQVALFSVLDKKHRVHRKKESHAAHAMTFSMDRAGTGLSARQTPAEPPNVEKFLQAEVSRVLMDRFAPPGVVVDNDMQIVQFRGQTGAFLEPAPGEASLNLLKMAKEGLLHGLRAAIHTARKTRNTTHKGGLQVRVDTGWKPVSLEVIPLAASGREHYLILFDDGVRAASARKKAPAPGARRQSKPQRKSQIDFLERELAANREYMQSIIQALEAANEELQSANEEIVSSNEELQSTNEELDTAKEELQSTNEELNTVNEELHGRNEELSLVNSDLVNLLGSVQIAIVIVSADLRIRRFTPMAERILNLIPTDVDRLIAHINPNIVGANLVELIGECVDTIGPIERDVQDRQGHWYSLRIRPYRVENKIDGAVVTLYDIDAPKRHEESVRSASALADAVVQASSTAIAIFDAELRIRSASPRFEELLAMTPEHWRSRALTDFVRADGCSELREFVKGDGPARETLSVTLNPSDGRNAVSVSARAFSAFDMPSSRLLLVTAVDAKAAAGAR